MISKTDAAEAPRLAVIATARTRLVLDLETGRYQSHQSPRGEGRERDGRERIARVVPAVGRQVRDEDGRAGGMHAPDVEQRREQPAGTAATRRVCATAASAPGDPQNQQRPSRDQRDSGEVIIARPRQS